MILGNCNIKIQNLYPRLDRDSTGDYCFSIGIEKSFAKKCYEKELDDIAFERLQDLGTKMINKSNHYKSDLKLFPYTFFKNKKHKTTCLISNLTVPGNACGLDYDFPFKGIEDDLEKIEDYERFIEFQPHNIDNPKQCYQLISLLTNWENLIENYVRDNHV